MPPQKRGRDKPVASAPASSSDAEMGSAHAPRRDSDDESDDDSDDDDSDDDELTFAEAMNDDDDDDEDDDMDGTHAATSANDRHVNVEFVFSDPREAHFHSVKQFLLSYLPSSQPFNVSGLANIIVGQVASGTMVCVEGEPDVYGFITALNLTRYKDESSVQQVLQYIGKRVPSATSARFQQILATKNVGLLVNERMVNLPYQLVPPLHAALHDDIEWAIDHEATPDLRASFKYDYFLILSSCTVEAATPSTGKGKKKAKTEFSAGAKFYANFEDEFLEPEAEIVFAFDTPRGEREDAAAVAHANKQSVVMLIERAKHKNALTSIASMINM